MLNVCALVGSVSLEEIYLTVSSQNCPQFVEVHLFEHRNTLGIQSSLAFPFVFEGIIGSWVFEVVSQGCDHHKEPLFFCQHFSEERTASIGLVDELSDRERTSSSEKAWVKLW